MAPKNRIAVVLMIQGNRDLLELTRKCLLLQGGIAVETVMSASEAIKKMETIKPDVIVCDLSYSCENSLDFLKKLRENRIDIPFISFAYDDEKDLVLKSLDLGANGFVFKSVDVGSAYEALKKLIASLTKVSVAASSDLRRITPETVMEASRAIWLNRECADSIGADATKLFDEVSKSNPKRLKIFNGKANRSILGGLLYLLGQYNNMKVTEKAIAKSLCTSEVTIRLSYRRWLSEFPEFFPNKSNPATFKKARLKI